MPQVRGAATIAWNELLPSLLPAQLGDTLSRAWCIQRRYAATTFFDFVAWLYVIAAYNRVVASAGSLSGGWVG